MKALLGIAGICLAVVGYLVYVNLVAFPRRCPSRAECEPGRGSWWQQDDKTGALRVPRR